MNNIFVNILIAYIEVIMFLQSAGIKLPKIHRNIMDNRRFQFFLVIFYLSYTSNRFSEALIATFLFFYIGYLYEPEKLTEMFGNTLGKEVGKVYQKINQSIGLVNNLNLDDIINKF
jgi:hypothetical protein